MSFGAPLRVTVLCAKRLLCGCASEAIFACVARDMLLHGNQRHNALPIEGADRMYCQDRMCCGGAEAHAHLNHFC